MLSEVILKQTIEKLLLTEDTKYWVLYEIC